MAKRLGPSWLASGIRRAARNMQRADEQSPRDLTAEVAEVTDPVDRARRLAELAAPADMLALIAIRHGLAPEVMDTYKHQLRLIADIASRSLSIVGLRAGEVQTFEVSDRFREFLERWQSPQPKVIDVTAEREASSSPSLSLDEDT